MKVAPSGGAQPTKTDGRTIDRIPLAKPEGPSVPTECPPSEPLCRYHYSQLKLVGVMQVGEGFLKGMVEDPDGRGYFVAPGTQIMGATVTQVTSRGMLIHIHKTNQDREVFLYRSGKETEEY
jgi:Tfp pilus assembly protein PilP